MLGTTFFSAEIYIFFWFLKLFKNIRFPYYISTYKIKSPFAKKMKLLESFSITITQKNYLVFHVKQM